MLQSEGFLSKLLKPLLKTGLPLMGNVNVLKPSAKILLMSLGLAAVTSAVYESTQNEIFGSGTTTLIFSNEVLNDIIKIVNLLKIPVY